MKNEWKQFVNDEYCHESSNDTFNLVCNKYVKTLKTAAVSEQKMCNIFNAKLCQIWIINKQINY